jgi:hypothetical protein
MQRIAQKLRPELLVLQPRLLRCLSRPWVGQNGKLYPELCFLIECEQLFHFSLYCAHMHGKQDTPPERLLLSIPDIAVLSIPGVTIDMQAPDKLTDLTRTNYSFLFAELATPVSLSDLCWPVSPTALESTR